MLVRAFMMNGLCLISKQLLVGHIPLKCLMPPALRCFLIQSCLYEDGTNLTEDRQLEEVQVSESDAANKNPVSNCAESAFPCRRQENVNSAVGDSCWGDGLLRDTSYDSRRRMNDRWEGTGSGVQLPFPNVAAPLNDEVSSAAADLQQLSLGKEEPAVPPSEDNHAVLFPEYMQALAADFSHLSFGTYKSGTYHAVSVPLALTPAKSNLEKASAAANGPSPPCKEIRQIPSSLLSTFKMSSLDPCQIHID
ncbi:uncharacterized protein LOC18099637 isoform X4 [Populus trichocarpa]|uniref:uncharacterized protein LOC18099637 isoform X4 n=1 Tax=Populus trichocarpa TaxID=3694 RepID=UPI000D18B23A|nr:uncharacterized protein LOC18099637 isoform X4 [Populus trichocarpa]|eukprot:XP_024457421.1 uncharacterized protein LOC18099637 isoform X4 [Populus trichocarpa]